MTLRLLLVTYLIGGLTFLPLLALTVLAVLFYISPSADKTNAGDGSSNKDDRVSASDASDGAACATFAVLRRYDFQGAVTALKDASNITEKADGGGDGLNGESVSVYQTMYRTVFDRNRNAANPLQESEETTAQKNKARSAGKVFYIVLRHGHLMLYDSAVQFEVRHVVSLAHYSLSLEDDITSRASDFLESDVFTRRTAIVLTPRDADSGKKPYFLFGDVNIEKEDFYYALLSSTAVPPIPRALDTDATIKLQSALHSNSLTPEARALNAMFGRVFLALHRTPFLEAFVRHKIETKMARIPKPAFIASMACHALNLGDAAPVISNMRLKEINISGETVLALDLKYAGGVNLTISAAAKLDLGPRFKTRMVSLLLAVVLRRLQGKMLVKIKPPPSNRIWICFETMPDMELKIEPVVSSRQITYAFVLRAIEARVREAFAEGLVQPHWDDIPFFATQEQRWRAGIWESEGAQDVEYEEELGEVAAEVYPLSQRNDKSSSMPTLVSGSVSSGVESGDTSAVKHRSTADLFTQAAKIAAEKAQVQLATEKPSVSPAHSVRAPRSLRSPSFAPPAPLVAVDDSSADAVRTSDSTTPIRRRWIGRNQPQTQKLDAAEAVRQVRDRDTLVRKDSSNEDLHATVADDHEQDDPDGAETYRRASSYSAEGVVSSAQGSSLTSPTDSLNSDPVLEGRHLRGASTDSAINPQRKTILASTAAATAAARQWTWNAVANRTKSQPLWNRNGTQKQNSRSTEDLPDAVAKPTQRKQNMPSGPVGRGQPLPPPGKPLPGPANKGIWSAATSGLGNIRRKPIPVLPSKPAARTNAEIAALTSSKPRLVAGHSVEDNSLAVGSHVVPTAPTKDASSITEGDSEFGPWMTNDLNDETTTDAHAVTDAVYDDEEAAPPHTIGDSEQATLPEVKIKEQPPPLPQRHEPLEASQPQRDDGHLAGIPSYDDSKETHAKARLGDAPDEGDISGSAALKEMHTRETSKASTDSEAIEPVDTLPKHADSHGKHPQSAQEIAIEHMDDLSDQEDLLQLEDDVQAIPAPVDAEAEASGILDLAEDLVEPKDSEIVATQAGRTSSNALTEDDVTTGVV